MKIRIEGNTLRLRLRKSELEIFSKEGEIIEVVEFSRKSLSYTIKMSLEDEIQVDYSNNIIRIDIPKTIADNWINSNDVAISNNDSTPQILIEKDFKCTTDSCLENVKDQSDFFDNPNEKC